MRNYALAESSFYVSQTLPPILQRLLGLAPNFLSLLAFALLGVEIARLIWLVMPAGDAWQPYAPPASVTTAKKSTPAFDIQPLLSANLYGEFIASPQTAPETGPVDAPDTKLRLTLRGIVAAESNEGSRALIESSPRDLMPYMVGMSIPGGATLHAIHADKVLLKRAGRLETLRLEKDRPTDPDAVKAMPATPDPVLAGGTTLGAETAGKLTEIRSELLNDPTKASRYLRMQPARRDGALVGYRIYPGRQRELFREVGLRPGDILTRVNGVDLNDPTRSLQLLGELSQASNIDITIERAGNLQSFSVSLNP